MTILLLETIHNDAVRVLESAAPLIVSPTPDALAHDLPFGDITAIITRGIGQLDRALMDACPNLKVIARCGAGLNNVDLKAAAEKNIDVVFAPGLNAMAVAEHTLMLMLMSIRQGFCSVLEVKRGNWNWRSDYFGDDLAGKKVCIVGGGQIGSKVAALCRAFSMDVEVCGRGGGGVESLKASLRAKMAVADVVSLHIPLNDETNGLFNRKMFSYVKPGALLVNTARGELIEQQALLGALDDGRLGFYASDVVAGESPAADDPLIDHPHTHITAHVASLTQRTFREMSLFTAENVVSVLTGERASPQSLYRGAA